MDQKADPGFIQDFLHTFIDPQLIHKAEQCKLDPNTQTLFRPSELAENSTSADLGERGWWKDVVEHDENKQSQGKCSYASQQALFDLDGAQSIKTMHKNNDATSVDHSQKSSKCVKMSSNAKEANKSAADSISCDSALQEDRDRRRLGHTPATLQTNNTLTLPVHSRTDRG